MTTIEDLSAEQYVCLTTFRKNGTAVPTPVWAAADGDALVVWTQAESGKVKRIRGNPGVVVAACDMRGNTRGEQVEGRARELSAGETERVRRLIVKKYGLTARALILGSRLRRGRDGTVAIRIAPAG
ncbi:PPOX class F420-dependent oxidoreductase [Streptosporangium roseum]|uniref:Pyridoxamine 5'-phosphate oxidase N-terminal domain-containing protein n=1 Tax=Streptosporangium roseum (strain ATCC 12428 / DSM 43021 / JCM 3005 / KCTC 9067 / NCIMB 10171 / NRRL 2505 / NI 9100) TaxID=479432 RepID=D2ARL2_STRRD|nr:PPOX class F420-dependent oxidoreductase [Streptosporangium roseum]ACZ90352.1 hypothetical protein Sros_7681 [Streptosporangium roseum DSM 43021]